MNECAISCFFAGIHHYFQHLSGVSFFWKFWKSSGGKKCGLEKSVDLFLAVCRCAVCQTLSILQGVKHQKLFFDKLMKE